MNQIVVVGAGAAGLATAARLARHATCRVKLVDAAETHFYQPIWTLVGGGLYPFEASAKSMASLIPSGIEHVKSNLSGIEPNESRITLDSGEQLSYDVLVMATGLELAYDAVDGLEVALSEDARVCSNYSPVYVKKTYPAIDAFTGGQALFTQPPMPFKCAGAPQKIMWIAEDEWRERGIKPSIHFNTATPAIFGVPKYAAELMKLAVARGVNVSTGSNLTAVDHVNSKAYFADGQELDYDFLHVTPPQRPIAPLRADTSITDGAGWVTVNNHSMQHTQHDNIFALGDCSSLPTSKTAAAVAAQNVIVAKNVISHLTGQQLDKSYEGYTSCPLVTSKSTVMLAEFGYDGKVMESFHFDQAQNRRSMFQLKKHFFTHAYWHLMLTGKWSGPGPFRPFTNPLGRN